MVTGMIALIMIIVGNWGAFFGTSIISLGFIGFGWAGYRLLLPDNDRSSWQGVSLVIGVMFGGAGSLMLIGSILLFVDGDFAGAIGLLIFGLVFCIAAYIGSRVFSIPKGMKEILVGKETQTIHGVLGQSGQLTGGTYIYVDEKTPDAEIETMQKNWAEKPWTQREDWAEGKVIQEGTGNMRLLIVFTVLWNIIAWGIAAYGISSEWNTPDVPWFLLVFPLIGIAFVIMTVRTWIRKRKFGTSIFHCETIPAYLGNRLQGTVQTGVPVKNQTAKEFFIRLICIRRTSLLDQEGKQRVSEETLWSQNQTVFGSISKTLPTFQVSVNVDIPKDLPPTELHPEDDRTLWRLEISSEVKGVDYAAQFEVPIYNRN
ncbi:MAG: hypothetical protein A2169_05785 [Deltaproteobacteria bacterium RBG_13_47_9]|nr:MAG: hypothetical protein A2169_05785 [Deltaproteobacteria bacterium RBG_13_47_9]